MKFKFVIILTILSLSSYALAQSTWEELITEDKVTRAKVVKLILSTAFTCKSRTGASMSDIIEAGQQKPPSTRPGKCLRACCMDAMGLYDSSAKFNAAQAKRFAHALRNGFGAKGVTLAHEVIDICSAIGVPANKCDSSTVYLKCLKTEGDKRGINIFHANPGDLPGSK